MGVIRKQSIQTTVLSYFGFGLGYVNAVLLFPAFFKPEEFGLTRLLIAVVAISAQVALFGMTNAIIKYFPRFKDGDEKKHHGILGLSIVSGLIGVLLVALALYLAKDAVIAYQNDSSGLFAQYYVLLFPFLVFEVMYQVFSAYTRALYHSVVNVFFKEVFLRITTTALILCFYFNWLNLEQFMWMYVLQQGLMVVGMMVYLKRIGHLSFGLDLPFLSPPLRSELRKYRSFMTLTNVSAFMLLSIDIIMIGYMLGLDQTAFYAVAFYIVALMNIPRNAISSISLPVISDAWKRDDRATVQDVYAKTSINQLAIGTFIFVGLWANEASIFQILPEEYSGGKWVLFFVGIGRLIDVGFGINGGVITTSSLYRFDTYSNLVLLVVTVVLNLIFIPIYGIVGAAIATAISLGLFNVAKYLFLKLKFGFEAFSWRSAAALALGAVAYTVSELLPVQTNYVLDILLRSTLVVVVFVPIGMWLKLSPDVNNMIFVLWKRLRI